MREQRALKIIGDVAVLKYQPGDVLRIQTSVDLSEDDIAEIKIVLEEKFGDNVPVIICGAGVKLDIIRPERQATTPQRDTGGTKYCSVCGKPQSGITCPEGHGGADSIGE